MHGRYKVLWYVLASCTLYGRIAQFILFHPGVRRKLEDAAKKKECAVIRDWIDAIVNHLYYCASSSGGDAELVVAKWLSILNHIVNIHSGHGDRFPNCAHGDIEERAWLRKG